MIYYTVTTTATFAESTMCQPCTSTPKVFVTFAATATTTCKGCGEKWTGSAADGTVESCSKCP